MIVTNSNGGYDWNTVYNFPVWLRMLTLRLLVKDNARQDENKSEESRKFVEEFKEKNKMGVPDYVMKAHKKQ